MSAQNLAGKRVAIYARFSSQLQREASIEDQVRRCAQFVAERGGSAPSELVFTDAAVSGASLQRPGFEKMMRLVDDRARPIDVIVTEDMSRISRDFADSASIFKRLQYLGVRLIGVGDGINTADPHAKIAFTMKSLMSDMYLDDLRDKTLRGLEGRALKGYSTGGLPFGYRSVPDHGPDGRTVIGHRVVIDEQAAAVVRRIFETYLRGMSLSSIAKELNAEGVPCARAHTRHQKKGWVDSTIRMMLHNPAYIGEWSFKKKQWVKVPGTNIRRYRARPADEVIRSSHPERRIIEEDTWQAVQARLAEVRACYTKKQNGPGASSSSGRRNAYVLSGLLRCGVCGGPMTICAGTSAAYYRCSDQWKRGTCTNKLSLREDVARRRILGALGERFRSPNALAHIRKKIAEHLGLRARTANAELDERRARLERVEAKIAGLIQFIAEGDRSEYVRNTLLDLEAHAKAEKAAIRALRDDAKAPVVLPSPDVVIERALSLERIAEHEPVRAREALRRLFEDGRISARPQPDGYYVAESRLFPLALLSLDLRDGVAETQKAQLLSEPGRLSKLDVSSSSGGCAGRI